MKTQPFILTLSSVGLNDIETAGGKNTSLGEMLQQLSPLGIHIPDGFVVTVHAYEYFMQEGGLNEQIKERLSEINHDNVESLRRAGLQIRSMIRNARFPSELSEAIRWD